MLYMENYRKIIVIFISKFINNYNDNIIKQNNDNMTILYEGQIYGRYDSLILNNIDNCIIKIYNRYRNKEFIFVGIAKHIKIINNRTIEINKKAEPHERLLLELTIYLQDIQNEIIYKNSNYCYKKSALIHAGVLSNNIRNGIYISN